MTLDLNEISKILSQIENNTANISKTNLEVFFDKGGIAVIASLLTLIATLIANYFITKKKLEAEKINSKAQRKHELKIKEIEISGDFLSEYKQNTLKEIDETTKKYHDFYNKAKVILNLVLDLKDFKSESMVNYTQSTESWSNEKEFLCNDLKYLLEMLDLKTDFNIEEHLNSLCNVDLGVGDPNMRTEMLKKLHEFNDKYKALRKSINIKKEKIQLLGIKVETIKS